MGAFCADFRIERADLSVGAEHVAVVRALRDVAVIRLPPGDFALLDALSRDRTLAEACTAAVTAGPERDIGAALAGVIGIGALCGVVAPAPDRD